MPRPRFLVAVVVAATAAAGCGSPSAPQARPPAAAANTANTPGSAAASSGGDATSAAPTPRPSVRPRPTGKKPAPKRSASATRRPSTPASRTTRLVAGNPTGRAAVPAEARAVDTSRPTRMIGTGTPASCTSAAVVAAVARGGVIRFNCGAKPVTIVMTATAKVRNNASRTVVLDGGGKVTLSGAGKRRILYQNTCDPAQVWTTPTCDNQDHPRLTVQNITFAQGNSTGQRADGGGGGAIFVRGGRLKVVNTRFVGNRCDSTGPDVGGAAIRVFDQWRDLPVYVVGSTFTGGICSNGGAISSIGVSWTILNSVMTGNRAIGRGANPAKAGTPGGGSGGAIYNDGNEMALRISGSVITDNRAVEGGGAIFFVSNNRTGTVRIERSRLERNPNSGFQTAGYPGIFFLGAGKPTLIASTLR